MFEENKTIINPAMIIMLVVQTHMKNEESCVIWDLRRKGYDSVRTDFMNEPGIPDLKCFNFTTKDSFYLEVKDESKQLSAIQKERIKKLINEGIVVKYALIKNYKINYYLLDQNLSKTFLESSEIPHIKTYTTTCSKCHYIWKARTEYPKECPKCKTRKWSQ